MCSAIVGLAAMLVSLPLPGYLTKHIQGAQQEKMKRVRHLRRRCTFILTSWTSCAQTDARVQTVTESTLHQSLFTLFIKIAYSPCHYFSDGCYPHGEVVRVGAAYG